MPGKNLLIVGLSLTAVFQLLTAACNISGDIGYQLISQGQRYQANIWPTAAEAQCLGASARKKGKDKDKKKKKPGTRALAKRGSGEKGSCNN